MIDLYLQERQKDGETLTANSPLIRQMYGKESADKPKFIALKTLGNNILALLEKAQLRENTVDGKRYEVMASHGLRKFCDGAMIMSRVNLAVKERLLGHTTGLDDSYFKPTEEYLLDEYLKAVELLTISNEAALKEEVNRLKAQVDDIDAMKLDLQKTKGDLEKVNKELEFRRAPRTIQFNEGQRELMIHFMEMAAKNPSFLDEFRTLSEQLDKRAQAKESDKGAGF
jgi:hypothetical protein